MAYATEEASGPEEEVIKHAVVHCTIPGEGKAEINHGSIVLVLDDKAQLQTLGSLMYRVCGIGEDYGPTLFAHLDDEFYWESPFERMIVTPFDQELHNTLMKTLSEAAERGERLNFNYRKIFEHWMMIVQ